jgi:hypothetical protein
VTHCTFPELSVYIEVRVEDLLISFGEDYVMISTAVAIPLIAMKSNCFWKETIKINNIINDHIKRLLMYLKSY